MKRRANDDDGTHHSSKRRRCQGLKRSRSCDMLLDEENPKRFCVREEPLVYTINTEYVDPDANVSEIEAYVCNEWMPRYVF